ncbi:MAG: hypothetical protein Q9183_002651 [Haloplaca sp. 2 TL-2023]
MPKRKSSTALAQSFPPQPEPPTNPPALPSEEGPPPKRTMRPNRSSQTKTSMNPEKNANVVDAPEALRASPDASGEDEKMDIDKAQDQDFVVNGDSDASLSEISDVDALIKSDATPAKASKKGATIKQTPAKADGNTSTPAKAKTGASKDSQFLDPEADGEAEEADEEELKQALARPPPVNIFSSRTCRIASILENRHPLRDPNEPPHATKNRPDREQPADVRRGQEFVEQLCLANVRDITKMLKWNDRYGIKFMRLSSEMFPFASHEEYGYKLAPFAAEALAEVGKVAAELGHRLTTHPGQFTQLGSPRKSVIDNALRDLDYHAELLSLLKMPPQQDRDAVMILHLGGVFGDKEATLDRFRKNYLALPQGVKDRLVLENDDVSWSVHDLLPVCEELNIPMVLDYHHHNIIFDSDKIREGTKDIVDLYPRILATWKRKSITPKMHYSEPTPEAITGRQRRKHNPRVATLPPCPQDMDLMIEAKDKEQAVFELMRIFKLPGYDTFNDMIPHVRKDDNKPIKTPKKKTPKKKTKKVKEEEEDEDDPSEPEPTQEVIANDDVGMGGREGRVYWPPGQEHWLRPVKRVVAPKKSKGPPGKELDEKGRIITPAMKKKREKEEQEKVKEEEKEKAVAEGERMAQEVEEQLNGEQVDEVKPTKGKKQSTGKSQKNGPKQKAVAEGEKMAQEVEEQLNGEQVNGVIPTKGKNKSKGKTQKVSKVEAKMEPPKANGQTVRKRNPRVKEVKEEVEAAPVKLERRQSTRGKKVDYAEE